MKLRFIRARYKQSGDWWCAVKMDWIFVKDLRRWFIEVLK